MIEPSFGLLILADAATGWFSGSAGEVRSIAIAQWVVWSLFLFAFGASIGSFVNVVAHRLPRRASLVSPPSRCPVCGGLLSWRENLPVLGWLLLRGRCKRCGTSISPQYVLVEVVLGLLFVATFLVLYLPPAGSWWGADTGDWWIERQFGDSWPACLAVLSMLAILVPITLIDAKTFLIPLSLTLVMAAIAAVAWPVQALVEPGFRVSLASPPVPLPLPSTEIACAALGGMLGVAVLTWLLRTGRITPSFADYESYVEEGETLGDYPHARRECLREAWQVGIVAMGLFIGWLVGGRMGASSLPDWLVAFGAVCVGYLVGGAMVWITRILGTLAFGREAMGLGDVHLLAAIGAVLGWGDAVAVFLIAPFFGIAAAAISGLLAAGWLGARFTEAGRRGREIPYGPHLALAAAFVVLGRPIVVEVRDAVLPPDVRERLVESARFTASIGAGSMAIEVGMEPTASTDGLPSGGIPMGLAHGMMERMP
ncbi:MAG: prepilin peptidase [Phycisphaerales bacterium]